MRTDRKPHLCEKASRGWKLIFELKVELEQKSTLQPPVPIDSAFFMMTTLLKTHKIRSFLQLPGSNVVRCWW